MRLKDGDGKRLKPANLTPHGPAGGVVHCVWGDAQWSRTQLLGEIARGHWGLCRASVAEMIAPPDERWDALDGRLVFAPETEMMEDFIRHGVQQMEREAALNARAGARSRAGGEDDEAEAEAEAEEAPAAAADAAQGDGAAAEPPAGGDGGAVVDASDPDDGAVASG